nr:metalloproteinase inhibitor 2-like [Nerophis lumbriciformis]
MSRLAKTLLLPLVLLCLWWLHEGVQACTCFGPNHPQQDFCEADVVIKAKVVGGKYDRYTRMFKYDIRQTKLFKGPKKHFDAIYTGANSAGCKVTLAIGVEHLLMASLLPEGLLRMSCGFYKPWSSISATQRSLLPIYHKGCDCKIVSCTSLPCGTNKPTECLWTDFLPTRIDKQDQSKNLACIKRGYGYCAWYRGFTLPKKGGKGVKGR